MPPVFRWRYFILPELGLCLAATLGLPALAHRADRVFAGAVLAAALAQGAVVFMALHRLSALVAA